MCGLFVLVQEFCLVYYSCSHFLLGFLALAGVRAVPTCSSALWQARWYLAPAPAAHQKPPVSHPCKTPWPPLCFATGRHSLSLEPEDIFSSSSWSGVRREFWGWSNVHPLCSLLGSVQGGDAAGWGGRSWELKWVVCLRLYMLFKEAYYWCLEKHGPWTI